MLLGLSIFGMKFSSMVLEQCNGVNLDSCICEQTYMFCQWVLFGNTPPSGDSTQTRILFIERTGTINGFYNTSTWPRLEHISTLDRKYTCRQGACLEIIQNLKTEAQTAVTNINYSDDLINSKTTAGRGLSSLHALHVISGETMPPTVFSKESPPALVTNSQETPSLETSPLDTAEDGELSILVNSTAASISISNGHANASSPNTANLIIQKNTEKHWEIVFIATTSFFSIILLILILLLVVLYLRLKQSPNRSIFNRASRYERWEEISL